MTIFDSDLITGGYMGEDRKNFCVAFYESAKRKKNPTRSEQRYIDDYERHLREVEQ